MATDSLFPALKRYAELIMEMRVLSSVIMEQQEDGAKEYADRLRDAYREIRKLGGESRKILRDELYPLLQGEQIPDEKALDALQKFCDLLLDPPSGEELDLILLYEVSGFLCEALEVGKDKNRLLRQLNMHVSVCYGNVNRTARITVSRKPTTFYRNEGLKAAHKALAYLDHDKFLQLSEEGRIYVLRVARFYSALYDTFYYEPESNRERFQALIDAIHLADDPFYRENTPNYPWDRHVCRAMEHMGQLTEQGNRWGFTEAQCIEIYQWMEKLKAFWEEDPVRGEKLLPEGHLRLIVLRNAYFAGKVDADEYRDGLVRLYHQFAKSRYDMHSVQMNLLIPTEYLATLQNERNLSKAQKEQIMEFYESIIPYILGSMNINAFNFLQEYLVAFLNVYIELPGGTSYEVMGLHCMAALHPPTYVHSMEVAEISRCLAGHLIAENPKYFGKLLLTRGQKDKMINLVYHSAICHDFGKIAMIDSIFMYGRNLLDREFDLIRLHGELGADMLSRHASTGDYIAVAREHHIWYNCAGGYLLQNDKALSPISMIVTVADCIDAATDMIGRSYNRGKILDEVIVELQEGAGTRYSPEVVALLENPDVCNDIKAILTEGRQDNYEETYRLLMDSEMFTKPS